MGPHVELVLRLDRSAPCLGLPSSPPAPSPVFPPHTLNPTHHQRGLVLTFHPHLSVTQEYASILLVAGAAPKPSWDQQNLCTSSWPLETRLRCLGRPSGCTAATWVTPLMLTPYRWPHWQQQPRRGAPSGRAQRADLPLFQLLSVLAV